MLAPVTEVHYGEEALLALNLASARRWPSFASELEAAAGARVGYRPCGTLLVAADEGDRSWLEELFAFQRDLGLAVEWLSGREARRLEPNLSPGVRAGMIAANDHQVDNRLLVAALLAAGENAGCSLHRARASSLEVAGGAVEGVRLDDDRLLRAPSVVLAAGAWSRDLAGLPEAAVPPVRPVKGQIMRLTTPPGPPLLERSVRGFVNGTPIYLVPRANGTVVIGGTVEEQGFDTSVTAGAVYEMLRDAQRVVPAVSELQLDEVIAGLRPGSPDNAPIVGKIASAQLSGLVLATGHYRNGVLLTPLTAEAVCAVLAAEEPPPEFQAFSPGRFQARSWAR
jgi:glycine oxidase